MLDIGRDDAQEALRQLDQAIYNHEKWLTDLTRTIICRLPPDQRDISQDAYHQCRFGQWYYSISVEALRDHPAFQAIGAEHQRMHELAARLLFSSEAGKASSTDDYDSFSNAIDRLHLEIYSLKHELEDTLHNRDPLTGAENRVGMLTSLRESRELVKRGIQRHSVAILDLDHLKEVNDAYGHRAGDQLLVTVVRKVKERLRRYDKVYRYGGDEFVISLADADQYAAQEVVERIRENLSEAVVEVGVRPDRIEAVVSFGIAPLDPDVEVEESIDRADHALYAAKSAGGNDARVWDASMTPIGASR